MFKKWLWKCWEYIATLLKFCFGVAAVILPSFGLAWLIIHYFTIGVITIGALVILIIGLASYLEIKYN
jgi:hypothetical protein